MDRNFGTRWLTRWGPHKIDNVRSTGQTSCILLAFSVTVVVDMQRMTRAWVGSKRSEAVKIEEEHTTLATKDTRRDAEPGGREESER